MREISQTIPTPLEAIPKLSEALGIKAQVFLKREDMHPLGSHKGRSIAPMVDEYIRLGVTKFCISSSGNAAIAAAKHIKELNKGNKKIDLFIYIGEHITAEKEKILMDLVDGHIVVSKVARPRQEATKMQQQGAQVLRQSIDDRALKGYISLAQELSAQLTGITDIFFATSSGTSLQGTYHGYSELGQKFPSFHAVQTGACHPMVDAVRNDTFTDEPNSLAQAIVDQVAFRRQKIVDVVTGTEGTAEVVYNAQLQKVKDICDTEGVQLSYNGLLALAGLAQSSRKDDSSRVVVCVVGGN